MFGLWDMYKSESVVSNEIKDIMVFMMNCKIFEDEWWKTSLERFLCKWNKIFGNTFPYLNFQNILSINKLIIQISNVNHYTNNRLISGKDELKVYVVVGFSLHYHEQL